MAFAFIHTADWQIGKPFGRLPAAKAAVLQQARLETVARIGALASERAIRHVLVAGDVFDSELPATSAAQGLVGGVLGAHRNVTWHLIPGDHDPARPGSFWERLDVPSNVRLHLASTPVEIAPDVVLLPAPLAAKALSADPTRWMDAAVTTPGVVRIGMAHGSVQGFGSLGEAAIPIDPRRAVSARLDFLALGDWHGTKEIAPRVWYSGTPEPDSFTDNDPGNVLVVTIGSPGDPARVERVPTARFRWLERRVRVARLADLAPLERQKEHLGAAAITHLVDLHIEGSLPVSDSPSLAQWLTKMEEGLFHVRCDRSRLRLVAASGTLDALEAGALRRIGERLAERAKGEDEAAAVATLALTHLLGFDAEAAGGRR